METVVQKRANHLAAVLGVGAVRTGAEMRLAEERLESDFYARGVKHPAAQSRLGRREPSRRGAGGPDRQTGV